MSYLQHLILENCLKSTTASTFLDDNILIVRKGKMFSGEIWGDSNPLRWGRQLEVFNWKCFALWLFDSPECRPHLANFKRLSWMAIPSYKGILVKNGVKCWFQKFMNELNSWIESLQPFTNHSNLDCPKKKLDELQTALREFPPKACSKISLELLISQFVLSRKRGKKISNLICSTTDVCAARKIEGTRAHCKRNCFYCAHCVLMVSTYSGYRFISSSFQFLFSSLLAIVLPVSSSAVFTSLVFCGAENVICLFSFRKLVDGKSLIPLSTYH